MSAIAAANLSVINELVTASPAGANSTFPTTIPCSGSPTTWTVPEGVTSIEALVVGAAGGGNSVNGASVPGGAGGAELATLSVMAGQNLDVEVGCMGGSSSHTGAAPVSSYPNGGAGVGTGTNSITSAAGGGASEVTSGSTVVDAGGGGGAGGSGNFCGYLCIPPGMGVIDSVGGAGGAGGGPSGASGSAGHSTTNSSGTAPGGSGGTGGTGSTSGTSSCSSGNGSGGNGGSSSSCGASYTGAGGGGGGGYFGGGGGDAGQVERVGSFGGTSSAGGGGGGGSSYSSVSGAQSESGVSTGNGYVEIAPRGTIGLPQLVGGPVTGSQRYGGGGGGRGGIAPGTCDCGTGDPVDIATGDFIESATDASIPTYGPGLSFRRTYDALSAQSEAASSTPGPLGYGWTDNWATSLSINSDYGTTVTGDITLNQANGSQALFVPPVSGACVSPYVGPGTTGTYCALPRVLGSLTYNSGTSTYTLAEHPSATYTFNSAGQLTAVADPNGDTETIAYNSPSPGSGNCPSSAASCEKVTSASGRTLTLGWSTSGDSGTVTSLTDPLGNRTSYAYSSGNLVSVTDPAGRVTSYGYDSSNSNLSLQHDMLTVTAPNGQSGGPDAGDKLTNVYNSSGQVTSQTDPMGLTTTFNYSAITGSTLTGNVVVTDPHGNETAYYYSQGTLYGTVAGYGTSLAATTSYNVDPSSLLDDSVTDPNGNVTAYTYDGDGNVLTKTVPSPGGTTTTTYNGFDEPSSVTDPMGIVTAYSYDGSGNLTQKVVTADSTCTSACTQTSNYTVCASSTCTVGSNSYIKGETESVEDPRTNTTTYGYDSAGDLATSANALGNETAKAYDADGRLYCTVSPNEVAASVACPSSESTTVSGTTSSTFNADSETVTSTDPLGNTTTYTYDADGNQTQVTDPQGNLTLSAYDADNRVTAVTKGSGTPSATTTRSGYDLAPSSGGPCLSSVSGATYCTTSTDGNGAVTVSYFNALDQKIEQTQPSSGTTTYGHDPVGNLTSETTSAGTTTNGYNADNEETSVTYSATASGFGTPPNVAYTYDANGERTTMTDGTGTTTYTRDGFERLASEQNGAGATTTYGYDADNNVTTIGYPSVGSVSYGFNSANEATSVTDWSSNTTHYTYDANGHISSETLPNGVLQNTSYDADSQIQSLVNHPSSDPASYYTSMIYYRNPDEQVGAEEDYGVPVSGATEWLSNGLYDPTGRMSSMWDGQATYDSAGNPTSLPGMSNMAYGSNEHLCWEGPASGSCGSAPSLSTSYTYGPTGDRTASTPPNTPGLSLGYDQSNNLTSVTSSTPSASPTYALAAGTVHMLAARPDGSVWAWGTNNWGDLGSSSESWSLVPQQVPGLTGATSVAAAGYTSFALKSDGTVWSWGNGNNGQLGDGHPWGQTTPAEVSGLTGAVAIAAGANTGYALTSAGTVYAWGYGADGELGNGTDPYTQDMPVAVSLSLPTGVTITAIAAAGSTAYALASNGAVYAWGDNSVGELGNGSTASSSDTPVQVSGVSGVTAISAGTTYAMALASGAVYAWGDNSSGQLGNGTTTSSSTPVTVSSLSGITAITASGSTSFAKSSAGVWDTWGANSSGQFGNGTTTGSTTPVSDASLTGMTLGSGQGFYDRGMGVTTTGQVENWGYGGYGTLGNNSTASSTTPVQTSLLGANPSAQVASYTYNGDGLRMSKTVAGTASQFTWDTQGTSGTPLALADGTNDYVYGPDGLPLEQVSGSSVSYFLHDQQGSTRFLTNATGGIVGSFIYDPYGREEASTGSVTTPLGYDGEYADGETGFIYMVHRYYDPATGQFLSVDPLVAQTGQAYAYAGDDPVNNSDPLGLWPSWSDLNPVTAAQQAWNDTGGKAVSYVHQHQTAFEVGAGVGLGVLAAATGVGAVVEGSVLLAGLSVTAGLGASALDYGPCMNGENTACVGLGLGLTGAVAGGFGLAGAGLVAGGVIAEDSTAAAILAGLGAFGWNVGIAGTILDATTGIASAAPLCADK